MQKPDHDVYVHHQIYNLRKLKNQSNFKNKKIAFSMRDIQNSRNLHVEKTYSTYYHENFFRINKLMTSLFSFAHDQHPLFHKHLLNFENKFNKKYSQMNLTNLQNQEFD